MDAVARPELAGCAADIATWADRHTPPPEAANPRLGEFPHLSPDHAFAERRPGETPWIASVVFAFATRMRMRAQPPTMSRSGAAPGRMPPRGAPAAVAPNRARKLSGRAREFGIASQRRSR